MYFNFSQMLLCEKLSSKLLAFQLFKRKQKSGFLPEILQIFMLAKHSDFLKTFFVA